MRYGWLIKHEKSGAYGVVTAAPDGLAVTITAKPEDATMFSTRAQVVEVLLHCHRESSTFPDCDIVDFTAPSEPVSDADQEPVLSRDAIIAAAIEGGKARRAAHAAERAARPSARLFEKPTSNNKAN